MSAAEAILAVLLPLGTFISGIVTIFIKRHLQHFDVIDKHLIAATASNAEIAVEMRLAREDRAGATKERQELRSEIATIKEVIRIELQDQRHEEIVAILHGRPSQNPPEVAPITTQVGRKSRPVGG